MTAPARPAGAGTGTDAPGATAAGDHGDGDAGEIPRFTGAERALHWSVAALLLTAAVTGLVLYVGPLTVLVGRRTLVRDVHVLSGLATPVPFVAAYGGRWRASVRRDVRRLARWTREDRRWLVSRGRVDAGAVGKFNAGQKANAAFVAGLVPLMVGTGAIMRWHAPFPLEWRTGATFVHDWTAIAAWLVISGHILVAVGRPAALRSMITGRMSRGYARDHHPRWVRGPARTDDELPRGGGRTVRWRPLDTDEGAPVQPRRR